MVRVVDVPVEVEKEEDAFEFAVEKMQNVGLDADDVVRAGLDLVCDFMYVSDSSEYEPEEV